MPCMIGGSQKWRGAAPILRRRAQRIIILEVSVAIKRVEALASSTADPIACTRKYFKAASEEKVFCFEKIRGMKERRLSSSPTQLINHEGEEIAITAPVISVERNNSVEGWISRIEKRKSFHRRGMSP